MAQMMIRVVDCSGAIISKLFAKAFVTHCPQFMATDRRVVDTVRSLSETV